MVGIVDLDERLKALEGNVVVPKPVIKDDKRFEFKIKIPGKVARASKKKDCYAVLVLDGNKRGYFETGRLIGGNIVLNNGFQFGFENVSVFLVGKKNVPLIVQYSWRITPVAGETDSVRAAESGEGKVDADGSVVGVSLVDVARDELFARKYGLINYAQQTIIRAMENAALPDLKKKMGGTSWLWIIIGGVVLLGVLQQIFVGG